MRSWLACRQRSLSWGLLDRRRSRRCTDKHPNVECSASDRFVLRVAIYDLASSIHRTLNVEYVNQSRTPSPSTCIHRDLGRYVVPLGRDSSCRPH